MVIIDLTSLHSESDGHEHDTDDEEYDGEEGEEFAKLRIREEELREELELLFEGCGWLLRLLVFGGGLLLVCVEGVLEWVGHVVEIILWERYLI
jgi:hypothetical protein